MKKGSRVGVPKVDRKMVEKNRRIHMKFLCFMLASLIPHHFKPSKDMITQQDQLHRATSYIKTLKEKIEALQVRKQLAIARRSSKGSNGDEIDRHKRMIASKLPVMNLKVMDSCLVLVFISGSSKNFMLHEIIRVFHEEGAEVVSASFSTVGDQIFHTIHAQVRILRIGVETTRLIERLQELIY